MDGVVGLRGSGQARTTVLALLAAGGPIGAMSDAIIDNLVRAKNETVGFFTHHGEVLDRSYAPGKWSMRQLLLHLVDCEGVYLDRARRLIADATPQLLAFDENRWAQQLFYDRRSLAVARAQYVADRDALIELARLAPPEALARAGVHSEAGRVTMGEILDKGQRHNHHHLEQLRAIATGYSWAPTTGR
jgi:hypothetical protein